MTMRRPGILILMAAAAALIAAAPVSASEWAGHNGVVRLSFSDGDTLAPVLEQHADTPVGVILDLYAVMTDVDPVVWNETAVEALGAFELKLIVEGAQPEFLSTDFPLECYNMGREPGSCVVGVFPEIRLYDGGPAVLVHWRLRFPEGLVGARGTDGFTEDATYALWAGSREAKHAGLIFSAGYAPAYLNFTGEPDLSVVRGEGDWREIGVVTEAAAAEAAAE